MAFLFSLFFLFISSTIGLPDAPLSTPSSVSGAPQYLVDVSYKADGQLEFTPNILQDVSGGAIIVFSAPTNVPFTLYETPYNPPQSLCTSYKKTQGLSTNAGTTQIFPVTSGMEAMAYFACPVVTSSCVCDGTSLFFLNPKSSISRQSVPSVTISDRSSSSATESYGPTKPAGASASTFATAGARSSTTGAAASETTADSKTSLASKSTSATTGAAASETTADSETSLASKSTPAANTQPSDVCS
ncbi:hypothetical protein Asppvi_005879 [Aspergillus pseudoviridinutans]|uniref:Uncharacterized protein n=1 Tax=Aspergillus pseudoviridinutans TaxID=1517512 RepID=A0A9P3EVN6_9EURO|nr:uncharacterized protein Asppvi_005879 [Aspergillus pseudoviridinutans]GIJ86980.1 hypothetical protein Asppvi_005879 [Aspergillus pseudoviridinutans]